MRYDRLQTVPEVEHYASVEVSSVQVHRLGPFSRVWNVYTDTYYPSSVVTDGGESGGLVLLLDTPANVNRPQVMHGPHGSWRDPKGMNRTDMEFSSTVLRLKMPWLFKFTENYWWYDSSENSKDCVTVTAYFRTGDLVHRVSTAFTEMWMAPVVAFFDFFSKRRTRKLTSRF